MSTGGFSFERGNVDKLLAIPKYVFSILLAWFVPRVEGRWVFGSGSGVAEGALAVARQLRLEDSNASITWLVASEAEAELAKAEGFAPVARRSAAGYWATLRAGRIVVTHGLGDANRFGISGGCVVQLWHGAPLKRLHLDSPVTTAVRGPAILRSVLRRMYVAGTRQVDLYVAGSALAADRLRSAFRVLPGRVKVLGDPRDDVLAEQAASPTQAADVRSQLQLLLGDAGTTISTDATVMLYAPTWRDGDPDPAAPSPDEVALIHDVLDRINAHLIVRSHPLGRGAYEALLENDRVHALGANVVRDITPLLGAIDVTITDYSSIAIDFSLLGRPIVWFAPDLEQYEGTRGLYEPLAVTSAGRFVRNWGSVVDRLQELHVSSVARRASEAETRGLAARFHRYPEGGAASRVLAEIRRLRLPDRELIAADSVFLESFYGRQVSCNPLALDREIAERFPETTRYWSVTRDDQAVPEGAIPLLVGSREWSAARRVAPLLIVNDWLRGGFKRRRGQTVLQTWHGTMLKHLALGRPNVGLRTRLAIRRESRRWNLLLSQNPHSTEVFRSSYAFSGEIIETGYPRDDRLARALVGDERNPIDVLQARASLGVPTHASVLVYAPTWRDGGITLVDELDVEQLAEELGDAWVVVARGHTRTHTFGRYGRGSGRVIDASHHPDVNDVILAADLLVTDYSSIMFDAAVAHVPLAFFVPDLPAYRDRERGFTFDFEREAPGPLLVTRAELVERAEELRTDGREAAWMVSAAPAAAAWRARFTPHDDGHAAERVVEALVSQGALGSPGR